MVVHFKHYCNTYGSVASYIIGFLVRVSGGEPLMNLQPFIYFPFWDEVNQEQLFPFRTLAMVLSLISVISFSMLTRYLFESGKLPPSWDVLRCVVNIPEDVVRVSGNEVEANEGEMSVMTGNTSVRKYSATDEMNGRVNPALNLGSDSDEEAAQQHLLAAGAGKLSTDSPTHRAVATAAASTAAPPTIVVRRATAQQHNRQPPPVKQRYEHPVASFIQIPNTRSFITFFFLIYCINLSSRW